MNILVTGGAGFIGSHVVDALLGRGDIVYCIDNFNDFYSPKLKRKYIQQHLKNSNYHLVEADILNSQIFQTLPKIDKIIHLAAYANVRDSRLDPIKYAKTNIEGTLNILEFARKQNIKKLVFASSSSVYGPADQIPFTENKLVDKSIAQYGTTKRCGELLCYNYHYLYNLSIVCLRFFSVYGPRGRPDMVPMKFTQLIDNNQQITIYDDGEQKRDYTYIADIVQGILASLDKEIQFDIFNIGDSRIITINYLIKLIEQNLGKQANKKYEPPFKEEVKITYANIDKAKQLLGYNPTTTVEEGVKKMIEWYKTLNKVDN